MAREYARVKLSIWGDDDFLSLSDSAQGLYFRLMTSPTLSLCGVADWRPNRLAALACDTTVESVRKAADELQEHGYVVVDDGTEEILVRSFVRHDGIIASPNQAKSMLNDLAATSSTPIRQAIRRELARLHAADPDLKGWPEVLKKLGNPLPNPSDNPSRNPIQNPLPNPSERVSASPSDNPSRNPIAIPHPSTVNQQPASLGGAKRAKQLPDSWQPNGKHRELAAELGVDLSGEVEQFRDFHTAKGSTFKDWDAALRTWLRNAAKFNGGRNIPRPNRSGPDWDAALAQAQALDAAEGGQS